MAQSNASVTYLPSRSIRNAAQQFETPFFVYDEKRIRANCRSFVSAFRRLFPSFSPMYALKANTNPHLLNIIFSEGFGADASSEAEAWIAHKLGASGMYTGNYTTEPEFKYVLRLGGFKLNLDDISMLPVIKKLGTPRFLSFRVNPGVSVDGTRALSLGTHDSKYGVPLNDIPTAYQKAKEMGAQYFGIHAMSGSNVLDARYFETITESLLQTVAHVRKTTGIEISCVNIGGGFGVPYRPSEKSLNLNSVVRRVRRAFDRVCKQHDMPEPLLMAEPGRFIMANSGWLVSRIHVVKKSHKTFIGVDAGMNDLPRPAIYGAYHHITALGKSRKGKLQRVNVVGRLCENNDQFAKNRMLPHASPGDILVIHNAGAHAYAMGHNYNNRLRSAEYLVRADGSLRKIRRAETVRDIFRTCTNL